MLQGALLALALALLPGTAAANSPEARAFDTFKNRADRPCQLEPAAHCLDEAWAYADIDGDGELSVEEFARVQQGVKDWLAWRRERLSTAQQTSISIGLLIVGTIGVERLIASYDANGNGTIDRAELTADIKADLETEPRPLGEVLEDRQSVDWDSLKGRIGFLGPLVDQVE